MVAELEKSSTDVETNEPRGGMLKRKRMRLLII